jgi:hypothetical protein
VPRSGGDVPAAEGHHRAQDEDGGAASGFAVGERVEVRLDGGQGIPLPAGVVRAGNGPRQVGDLALRFVRVPASTMVRLRQHPCDLERRISGPPIGTGQPVAAGPRTGRAPDRSAPDRSAPDRSAPARECRAERR